MAMQRSARDNTVPQQLCVAPTNRGKTATVWYGRRRLYQRLKRAHVHGRMPAMSRWFARGLKSGAIRLDPLP